MNHLSGYDAKELLSIFIEKSDNGYAMYNKEDRVIYCNQNYARQIYGRDSAEIIGLTFPENIKIAFNAQRGIKIETSNVDAWIDKACSKRWQVNYQSFEINLRNGNWLLITEQIIDENFQFIQCTDITKTKELENTLATQAYNDELTLIPNRRAFVEYSYGEIQKSFRNKTPFILYLFDIDFFKAINDQSGHLAGDYILRSLADLVKGKLRGYDYIARIGGDEFVLLFTDTTKESALSTVERIRLEVEKACFNFEDNDLNITLSLGGTAIREGDLLDDMIGRADQNLYEAKRLGRNKVVSCEPGSA